MSSNPYRSNTKKLLTHHAPGYYRRVLHNSSSYDNDVTSDDSFWGLGGESLVNYSNKMSPKLDNNQFFSNEYYPDVENNEFLMQELLFLVEGEYKKRENIVDRMSDLVMDIKCHIADGISHQFFPTSVIRANAFSIEKEADSLFWEINKFFFTFLKFEELKRINDEIHASLLENCPSECHYTDEVEHVVNKAISEIYYAINSHMIIDYNLSFRNFQVLIRSVIEKQSEILLKIFNTIESVNVFMESLRLAVGEFVLQVVKEFEIISSSGLDNEKIKKLIFIKDEVCYWYEELAELSNTGATGTIKDKNRTSRALFFLESAIRNFEIYLGKTHPAVF